MKRCYLVFTFILLVSLYVSAQNAKDILKQAFAKSQQITHGYFAMDFYTINNYNRNGPIYKNTLKIDFKKLMNDSTSQCLFNIKSFTNEKRYSTNIIYTGEEFINYNVVTDIGEIILKSDYPNIVKKRCQSEGMRYGAFMVANSYPLPKHADFESDDIVYNYFGIEQIGSFSCYHVQMRRVQKEIPSSVTTSIGVYNSQTSYDFWINIKDSVTVQVLTNSEINQGNVINKIAYYTTVTDYRFQTFQDSSVFSKAIVPSYIKLAVNPPNSVKELVKIGTVASPWSGETYYGQKLSSKDFKGKPLMLVFVLNVSDNIQSQLTELQTLQDKYQEDNLNIVLINNGFSVNDESVKKVLESANITIPVITHKNIEIKSTFGVASYPTYILINKKGTVEFTNIGYGINSTINRIKGELKKMF